MNSLKSKGAASLVNISKFIKQNYRVYILENEIDISKIRSLNHFNNGIMRLNHSFLFEWKKIGLVDLIYKDSEEFISCPICMESDILVPKMSSCGHVFCWPCIVKYIYFNMEDDKMIWQFRCPVCFTFAPNELVSVRYQVVKNINIGSKINLCLLFREFSSSMVHYDLSKAVSTSKIFFNKDEAGVHFQRIGFLSDINDVLLYDLQILLRRKFEFENMIGMEEELYYINECISILCERMGLRGVETSEMDLYCENIPLVSRYNENELLVELEKKSTSLEDSELVSDVRNIFYFYQCYDGQLIFLEPFYVKILQFEFGSIDKIPRVLLNVDILYVKELILDCFISKRYKFLSHLPIGSTVKMIGIDIVPFISSETRCKFGDKIDKRLSMNLKSGSSTRNFEQLKHIYISRPTRSRTKLKFVHNHPTNRQEHKNVSSSTDA